jgi:hypothetical protein
VPTPEDGKAVAFFNYHLTLGKLSCYKSEVLSGFSEVAVVNVVVGMVLGRFSRASRAYLRQMFEP